MKALLGGMGGGAARPRRPGDFMFTAATAAVIGSLTVRVLCLAPALAADPLSGSSSSGSSGSSGIDGDNNGSISGYLHTDGATIVDASGKAVRLAGVSWFGFETSTVVPHGLDLHPISFYLDKVREMGFNFIRLPFASEMFDPLSIPAWADFNPELKGFTPLQIMDKIIAGARERGLRVLLDRHRPDSTGQSPLWYTEWYSEKRWIDEWKMLAARYKGDPTVFGVDLHNEPHGAASWGTGDSETDWRLAAQRAGNAVLSVNPDLLIVVEGIENYNHSW